MFAVIAFRHGWFRQIAPLHFALTLLCFLTCMGSACSWLIIRDHAVYAVEPEQTSTIRLFANLAVVGVLGLLACVKPLTRGVPLTTTPSHE